jgi:hypothetical protein
MNATWSSEWRTERTPPIFYDHTSLCISLYSKSLQPMPQPTSQGLQYYVTAHALSLPNLYCIYITRSTVILQQYLTSLQLRYHLYSTT